MWPWIIGLVGSFPTATSYEVGFCEGMRMPLLPLEVRPSDCDVYGHVNNAVYASYFEYALAHSLNTLGFEADWQPNSTLYWTPHSLTLEYRQPAIWGDTLQGHIWLSKPDAIRPSFGFEILRPREGPQPLAPAVFRAEGTWGRNSRETDEPQEIPSVLLTALANEEGAIPRLRPPTLLSSQTRKYVFEHPVQGSEVGPSGHLQLQALYRLLEESLSDSCDQAGWPKERWLAAGFFTVQTRHDSRIYSLPRAREFISITSQLIESRRLGGTWQIVVRRDTDGPVLVEDYSTGVHLNLEGHPASPPAQILQAIQFG